MGQNEDFSAEEMEFFVQCFMKNLSNGEIREEIQDTEFPLRPVRTIGKIRKIYEAVKKAYERKFYEAAEAKLESSLDKMAEHAIKGKTTLDIRQIIDLISHINKGDIPLFDEKTGELEYDKKTGEIRYLPADF